MRTYAETRVRVALARLAIGLTLAGAGACGGDGEDGAGNPDAGMQTGDPPGPPTGEPEVTVSEGTLRGKRSGTTRQFLGIPYAEPPVGARRFAAPEPVAAWQGVKQAVAHGASCPQTASALGAPGPLSEDCLSLNVYAPEPATKLPVIVWIHGGAYVTGGSVQYDGTRLASEGPVVVVTINYRLGALGFLSYAGLDQVRGGAPSGNDALRDQQLALRWVRRNIAAFGGDPDNVTVVGESAGGASVCMHLVSPESQDLARRFVMQSSVCIGGLPISAKDRADALGEELATGLCGSAADKVACLREKTTAEVLAWGANRSTIGAGWNPVVNASDPVLPEHPLTLIKAGRYHAGEIVVGTNENEWGLFVFGAPLMRVTSLATFDTQLQVQYGANSASIKAHYAPTEQTAYDAYVKLMTDAVFRCPARALARLTSARGTKVYLYSFEESLAWHSYEIPYVFGNPVPLIAPNLIEPLRKAMQGYWRSFARDGDPNGEDELAWPSYDTSRDQHLVLKASPEVGSGLSASDCDFWDQLAATGPIPSPKF